MLLATDTSNCRQGLQKRLDNQIRSVELDGMSLTTIAMTEYRLENSSL